ncbi:MAG: hypothetical protein ACR2PX_28445 [Endozoicomonas sp.]|uniref:hypothetical protein n=1 Tax=Endozoicomonas sp. TaxID=1892382 RepID=UPI003D9B9722
MSSLARIAFLSLFLIITHLRAEDQNIWYWQSFGPYNSLSRYRDVIDDFSTLICRARVEDGPWLAGILNKDGSQCIILEDGSEHDHFQLPIGSGFSRNEWQAKMPEFKVNAMRASSEANDTPLYELKHQTQLWCRFRVDKLFVLGVLMNMDEALLCQALDQQSSKHYEIATYQYKVEWPEFIPYIVMLSAVGFVMLMAKYIR